MIHARYFFFASFYVLFWTCLSWGEETVSFKIDIERDGDASSSFNCTVVVNIVENGAIRTLRIPDALGKLLDSIHINQPKHELSIERRRLFIDNEKVAKLRFFVISSRHMPAEFSTWMTMNDGELLVRALIESRESYRARADGVRVPLASAEIRRFAQMLDPKHHGELLEALEQEAIAEDKFEKWKAARLTEPLSLILPAYIYPPDVGAAVDKSNLLAQMNIKDWVTIERDLAKLTQLGIESLVIVNPPVGENVGIDKQYEAKIAILRNLGAKPLGYVRLGAGSGIERNYDTEESIQQQLTNWKRRYPQVEGFFFDTCPADETSFPKVEGMARFAKSLFPKAKIVINPGTFPDERYMNSDAIDIVCACETNLDASTVKQAPPVDAKLAAILWDAKQNPEEEITTLRAKGFTFFYVTDRNEHVDLDGVQGPDANLQWGRLPSSAIWNNLLNTLARSKVKQSNQNRQ
jgi:hypothetical protein